MAKPNIISKEDLIQFAMKCIVDHGMEKFTLRSVAERAGVTQGTVYYHFRTKEQLLLDIVKEICSSSWDEISQTNENVIKQAIESAKSRCGADSFYHKMFFTLMVSGINNEKIRAQLGELIEKENMALSENLQRVWAKSPVIGISLDEWGVLVNAIIDGIAMQALMVKDFPVERIYEGLEQLFLTISKLKHKEVNE